MVGRTVNSVCAQAIAIPCRDGVHKKGMSESVGLRLDGTEFKCMLGSCSAVGWSEDVVYWNCYYF